MTLSLCTARSGLTSKVELLPPAWVSQTVRLAVVLCWTLAAEHDAIGFARCGQVQRWDPSINSPKQCVAKRV